MKTITALFSRPISRHNKTTALLYLIVGLQCYDIEWLVVGHVALLLALISCFSAEEGDESDPGREPDNVHGPVLTHERKEWN